MILVDSRGEENRRGRSCAIVGNVVGKDLPVLLVVSGRALERSVERSCQGSLRQEEENTVVGTLSWCLVKMLVLVCVSRTSLQS